MPPVSRHPSNMDDASDEGDNFCPLCMEEMDMTDRQFKPCSCGYQICVWCWHHIMEMAEKDNIEGRCPACRMSYDKEKIVATTTSCEGWLESSNEKKQRSSKSKSRAVEGRKNLSNVRVLQRNLVYVVGLPANLADEEALERREFFGQYGNILKLSISRPSSHYSQHSSSGSTVSVHVTFSKEEDATRCIQAVNGCCLEGSTLRACLGTTKYCNAWLKNMQCNNPECLYLHDEGNREDSFTKEDMLAKFGSKAQQFQELTHAAQRYFGTGLPPPITEVSAASPISNPAASTGPLLKSSLDVGSSGKMTGLPAAASWGSRGTSVTRSSSSMRPSGPTSSRLKMHKPPSLPVSGSSFQTPSVLPLASTTASVTVLGCRPSSELLKPTVLMSGSPKLLLGAPKQSNMKNGKMAVGLLQSSSNSLTSEIESVNIGVAALRVEGQSGTRDSCLPLEIQNATSSCADIIFDSHEDNGALITLADTVDDWNKNDMKNAGMRIQPISDIKIFGSFSCDTPTDSRDIVMAACSKEVGRVSKISDCSSGIASHIRTEAHTCSVEANMGTSHVAADTVHDSSDVSGVNVKLDVVSESNESGSEGKNEFLLPSDELLKGSWLPSVPLECSETSSDSRCQEAVMTTIELNLLKEPSIQNVAGEYSGTDVVLGNQEGGGTGESKLYSDVLPTGFDIWSDGSPDDLADLVFGEKKDSLLSPNSCEGTSIWKTQNSRQSRFHFARQQESLKDHFGRHQDSLKDLSSPTRTCSEVVCLQFEQTAEPVTTKQIDIRNSNSDFYKGNRLSSDGIFDSMRGANSKGKTTVTPSPKSLLSAPPGFSLSTRATSTPPGFSNGKNLKASGQVLDKTSFAPTACQQAVSSSSEIEFIDPAIMAVGRGKFRASLNDPLLLVPERNMQSSSVNSCWNSSPGALNAKEYSRAFDSDLNSQVQQMALYRDANSPSHSLNQNLDARFPSFLPYSNEHTGAARLFMPSYQDRSNSTITKIGIQDLAYKTPELRFQQSGGNIWETWSRAGSVADSTIARQRLAYNGIGNSNATHHIVERTVQSLYGETTANKEIPSRSFWDGLPLNGQSDQGQFNNQRIL